jgi:hypothetical protein
MWPGSSTKFSNDGSTKKYGGNGDRIKYKIKKGFSNKFSEYFKYPPYPAELSIFEKYMLSLLSNAASYISNISDRLKDDTSIRISGKTISRSLPFK